MPPLLFKHRTRKRKFVNEQGQTVRCVLDVGSCGPFEGQQLYHYWAVQAQLRPHLDGYNITFCPTSVPLLQQVVTKAVRRTVSVFTDVVSMDLGPYEGSSVWHWLLSCLSLHSHLTAFHAQKHGILAVAAKRHGCNRSSTLWYSRRKLARYLFLGTVVPPDAADAIRRAVKAYDVLQEHGLVVLSTRTQGSRNKETGLRTGSLPLKLLTVRVHQKIQ